MEMSFNLGWRKELFRDLVRDPAYPLPEFTTCPDGQWAKNGYCYAWCGDGNGDGKGPCGDGTSSECCEDDSHFQSWYRQVDDDSCVCGSLTSGIVNDITETNYHTTTPPHHATTPPFLVSDAADAAESDNDEPSGTWQ